MGLQTDFFSHIIDRTGTGSCKWDLMREANPNVEAGIAPLSTADLDFPPPTVIRDAIVDAVTNGAVGYTAPTPELLRSIQTWLATRHAWAIDTDWLSFMPGVVPGLFAAVKATTSPGDGVILPTPAYPPMAHAIEHAGRTLIDVPLELWNGRYIWDFEALRAAAAKPSTTAIILCSPHNPTGRVWTMAELEELARIAHEYDLAIIDDEIHFDLVTEGYEHIPIAALTEDAAARTITLTAPSKTFNVAGLMTSYAIIADPTRRNRYRAELAGSGLMLVPALGLVALKAAYDHGAAWVDDLMHCVARNDTIARDFFTQHFPEVVIPPREGTFLMWMDFRSLGLTAEQLAAKHHGEAQVFFDQGAQFRAPGFQRLNLGTSEDQLRGALERLRRAYGR